MAEFSYRASRSDGTVIEASTQGESEACIRRQLEQQGLVVFYLTAPTSRSFDWPSFARPRLSLRQFLIFNQQFLALLKAGVPILKAFEILVARTHVPSFRQTLESVRARIREGASISEAMAVHPHYFSELYRASLRSGEQTGALSDILKRYIAYLHLVIGVREKVTKALAYPFFLLVVGAAVVSFLLIYVMPSFADVYGQSQSQLPLPTQWLIHAVRDSYRWLPVALLSAGFLIGCLYLWRQTPTGRYQLDYCMLKFPIVGDILLKDQIIRITRTLSMILTAGIPLIGALETTTTAVTNRPLIQALERTRSRVCEGITLAIALGQEHWFPAMTLEMIAVGETTGALETVLMDIAEFHEGELDLRLNQLMTWIEPVLLLIMGVIVGAIVIVMYLPIFQMAGSV